MTQEHKCCCQAGATEEEMLKQLDDIIETYQKTEGALIPILQTAQRLFGYLPEKVIKKISVKLNKPYSEVAGVVNFYSFFSTVPRGKYVVRVCLGTACYVRGGKDVLEALRKELAVDVGQTTSDKLFSLDVGRCFGACGLAPVIMVNDDVHQRVKPVKVGELLDAYRNKEADDKEVN